MNQILQEMLDLVPDYIEKIVSTKDDTEICGSGTCTNPSKPCSAIEPHVTLAVAILVTPIGRSGEIILV